jgi:hypothetical protein
MADPDRIRELVTGAGFGEPRIDEVPVEWGYADAAEHWEKTNKLAAPIAEAVSGLSDEERERVRMVVAERIEERLGDGVNGLTYVVAAE